MRVVVPIALLLAVPIAHASDNDRQGGHPGRAYTSTERDCALHAHADRRSAVIREVAARTAVMVRTQLGRGNWVRVEIGRGPRIEGLDKGYLLESCFEPPVLRL